MRRDMRADKADIVNLPQKRFTQTSRPRPI